MDAGSRTAGRIDFSQRKRIIMPRTTMTVPPKPTRGPCPPLYRDFENCEPGDQDCINRNVARVRANQVIMTNHGNDYLLRICLRNNALNINVGHPEHARDCENMYQQLPVPKAPGVRTFKDGSVPDVDMAPPELEDQVQGVAMSDDDRVVLHRIDEGLKDLLSYFK